MDWGLAFDIGEWVIRIVMIPVVALRLAALGCAEVDLILPEESDRGIADAAARTFLPPLLAAGVHVHYFPDGMLHCKSMSSDDEVSIIGSANFDRRSLFLNYEANLIIFDRGFTADLRSCQDRFKRQSRELPQDWWHHRSSVRKTADQMAKLLSPLL